MVGEPGFNRGQFPDGYGRGRGTSKADEGGGIGRVLAVLGGAVGGELQMCSPRRTRQLPKPVDDQWESVLVQQMSSGKGSTAIRLAAKWIERADGGGYRMEEQFNQIARSYDVAIELGKQGIDPYQELPAWITNDPDYLLFQKEGGASSGSGNQKIWEYLSPQHGMAFIDLGCCLNFMFHNYSAWPSVYYGVDISRKTIQLLQDYAADKQLAFGQFTCGSIHNTPYRDSFFDIGACIGVLEYFQKEFVEMAMEEAHRILKSGGRLVLDIPNLGTPSCRIMMMIEEYLGRPDTFDLSVEQFEGIVEQFFAIERKEAMATGMLQYYLRCKEIPGRWLLKKDGSVDGS